MKSYICDINYKNEQAYIYLLLSSVLFTSCIQPRFNLLTKKDNSETEMAISIIGKTI
jgi:hypothetical protein